MQTNSKLYKSSEDKALFGVCGGIAEYFKVDSLIVRLLFVLFTLMYGVGLLFYIVAALVIPTAPSMYSGNNAQEARTKDSSFSTDNASNAPRYIAQDGTAYENRAATPVQSGEEGTKFSAQEGSPSDTQEGFKPYSKDFQTKGSAHPSGKTIGLALIAVGALIMIQVFLPWIDRRLIVASCLIFAGFILLSKKPK